MTLVSTTFSKSVHDYWGFFLAEGLVMIVFGAVAIVLPPLAGIAVTILLGWLLLASGLFGVVTTLMSRHAPGFWWSLFSSIITATVGALLYSWPLGGALSLSLALAGFLILDGIFAIGMALDHRRALSPKWGWLLINGTADLVVAGLIVLWLPQSAAWALGLIVGFDMVMGGATLAAMAVDSRKHA